MSDLENELLGLAEDDPHRRSKKRRTSPGTKRKKSSTYVEGSEEAEDMDMDMDLESEEDDRPTHPVATSSQSRIGDYGQGQNPFPLEGKYIDEDDRDRLEAMPEIERENILASRLEEMQKFKDSQQLDAMYKMAGMGGGGEDETAEDDGHSRKKRKHTSVTKEASKAMAARRERRHRSGSPSGSHSTEDGEISFPTSYRRSPEPSPPRKVADAAKKESKETDLDAVPANRQELNSARLSRYELVDMMYRDRFEDVVTDVGAFVRLMAAEPDERGLPKYRIHKLIGGIEYKGRTVMDNRALMCQYGKAKRLFRIADVSNGDFEDSEFSRFDMTNHADGVKPPKRSDLKTKHEAIKRLRDRPMTNDEINRQVEARKKYNPMVQRQKTIQEITALISSRNSAIRRNDHDAADEINRQIISLGGDPSTGQLVTTDVHEVAQNASDYDMRIQKINENNKRKTKEAMAAAHAASMQRKKAEEAIVRSRQLNASSPVLAAIPVAIIPPESGLRKGETPQQYVARTIDLDLGDF
ncbi:MAG: hypothetical protein TREMPRED_002430 [Tremellales sp. Tagirdzhanova-0007]|nr:MAG: hypothetical protein TREMPRED_002430 [Tremellales sp. Tagirdzhanova-0007]